MKRIWERATAFSNCEDLGDYDFVFARSREQAGVSAVVRVRNEAAKIGHSLRSILPVFDEIVVVDNQSDDGTGTIVRELQETADPKGKIRLLSYPHRLARFGPEHDRTPGDSVHSAVYYTNWSIAQCSFRYVCKWDGDMVLIRNVRDRFRSFLEVIQTGRRKCWVLAGQTLYRGLDGHFYLARGEINREVEIFPYGAGCRFVKARHWERLRRPRFMGKGEFSPVCFFELKFANEDEFSHWSSQDWPTARKKREWNNYWLVRNGEVSDSQFEKLPETFLDSEIGDEEIGTHAS
jgi:glycosyltransferase involved in cell wall biosynthesis